MRFATAFCALVLSGVCSGALAQSMPSADQAAPLPPQVVMPDAEKIVLWLRVTLITLNDAVQTGNFTVLRDMGAPGFREANTAARLSQSFSDLAAKGVDLSSVSIIAVAAVRAAFARPGQGHAASQRLFSRRAGADQFRNAVPGGRWALAFVRAVGAARAPSIARARGG